MEYMHYKVAGHSFLIQTDEPELISSLLPSYSPFLVEKKEQAEPVFRLALSASEPELYGTEVYRFVWEGAGYIIYQGVEGYSFHIFPADAGESWLMRTDMAFSDATVCMRGNAKTDAFVLNNCLMMLYAFATASTGTLLVHASVTSNDGRGYLFLGKSGTGKSTHSALWMKHIPGSDLMNDDNPVLRVTADGIIVSGSPWSGKTPCYKNIQLPVGAVVKLNQAPANKIEKSKPSQAFAALLSSCSAMKWDKRVYDGICDTVSEVVVKVPFYALDCLPDAAAAGLCHSTAANG